MDERWESEVVEYGAINITGFRIVDSYKPYVKDFLEGNNVNHLFQNMQCENRTFLSRTFCNSFLIQLNY